MNIVKLQRMVAVYEAGSFRKAAQDLGMSQPALTWSIRQLEDELNIRLFDRGPRGIEPTEMCEKLISRARLIMREQDRMMADVERNNRDQMIAVGVHSSMMHAGFARCIAAFADTVPGAVLRITPGYSSELLDNLKRGELDFAYCTLPTAVETEGLLRIDPVKALGYSVVAEAQHPAFDDIAAGRPVGSYPWTMFDPGPGGGAFPGTGDLDAVFEQTGFPRARQEVRTTSMAVIRLLIVEGGHIGMIADELIAAELASGQLRRLPHAPIHSSPMGFVSVQGSYDTPLVLKLKAALRRLAMQPLG